MTCVEDIELATKKVATVLGKSGRMLPVGKNVAYNVTVTSKNHGRLWYGDVDLVADSAKLDKVRDTLRESIYVLPDGEWALISALFVSTVSK